MGIDINALKFMAAAKADGVDFRRTVMIGRQSMYVTREQVDQEIPSPPAAKVEASDDEAYAEWVLRRLGAEQIDSVDASDYERANIIHDMNAPIPASLREKYGVVLEIGSLEHIFNFPVAIRNCMEMLEVGGRFVSVTVANNFCGHGFYQFSPDLYYRIFSPENGFEIEKLYVCDAFTDSKWYRAIDPAQLPIRGELVGPYRVSLCIQARKVAAVEPFRKPPQQSFYNSIWNGEEAAGEHRARSRRFGKQQLVGLIRGMLPRKLKQKIQQFRSDRQYASEAFQLETPNRSGAR